MSFKCSICNYVANKFCVQRHIKKKCGEKAYVVWTGVTYKCEYCEKVYMHDRSLQRHLKTCKVLNKTNEEQVIEDLKQQLEEQHRQNVEEFKQQLEEQQQQIQELKTENKLLKRKFGQELKKDIAKSTIRKRARKKYLENTSYFSCVHCGYIDSENINGHFTISTEVCHIKAIKDFKDCDPVNEINDLSNLIGLCPTCHKALDVFKIFEVVRTAALHRMLINKYKIMNSSVFLNLQNILTP